MLVVKLVTLIGWGSGFGAGVDVSGFVWLFELFEFDLLLEDEALELLFEFDELLVVVVVELDGLLQQLYYLNCLIDN